MVEYGLLAMLLITLVSIGATLGAGKLNGVFCAVAAAIEQSGRPQNLVSFAQRTNRKGAPIEREVSGKLSTIAAAPLY
jgi:Flp pilus assembly pilin Flp